MIRRTYVDLLGPTAWLLPVGITTSYYRGLDLRGVVADTKKSPGGAASLNVAHLFLPSLITQSVSKQMRMAVTHEQKQLWLSLTAWRRSTAEYENGGNLRQHCLAASSTVNTAPIMARHLQANLSQLRMSRNESVAIQRKTLASTLKRVALSAFDFYLVFGLFSSNLEPLRHVIFLMLSSYQQHLRIALSLLQDVG